MDKTERCGKNHNRFIAMPGINRFSERLAIAMEGLTNVALASSCGISESAIRSYLKGHSYPSIDKIDAIAKACDTPMNWLITGECVAEKNESDIETSELKAASLIGLLSKEQQQNLVLAIVEHGVTGIISALNGMKVMNEFMQIPENDRANMLSLYNKTKGKMPTDNQAVVTTKSEHEYTDEELEAMIMALPVRESLKTAFSRGVTAGEDADQEILRILESHQRRISPEGVSTDTPESSLKSKAG
ncbi:helix-turn-helix transcriptional regulator [Salmonella enterica]|nr:helix-turn-helix transcriptional regulator [Salmonella enterica]